MGAPRRSGPIAAEPGLDPRDARPRRQRGRGARRPPGGDSVLDVLAQAGQDTRLIASAAVLTLAGAALLGPRAGGSGADVRMAFANVRLLPCLLREAPDRQLTALTEALAPAAAPAASALAGGVGTAGTAIRTVTRSR